MAEKRPQGKKKSHKKHGVESANGATNGATGESAEQQAPPSEDVIDAEFKESK